jgi:hypothetical protein
MLRQPALEFLIMLRLQPHIHPTVHIARRAIPFRLTRTQCPHSIWCPATARSHHSRHQTNQPRHHLPLTALPAHVRSLRRTAMILHVGNKRLILPPHIPAPCSPQKKPPLPPPRPPRQQTLHPFIDPLMRQPTDPHRQLDRWPIHIPAHHRRAVQRLQPKPMPQRKSSQPTPKHHMLRMRKRLIESLLIRHPPLRNGQRARSADFSPLHNPSAFPTAHSPLQQKTP